MMWQNRLNNLTLMNTEYNLIREIDLPTAVHKFAHIYLRKVCKSCLLFSIYFLGLLVIFAAGPALA